MQQLHGRHVLVVEDEYFLANEIEDELDQEGAVVFGPFASMEEVQDSVLDMTEAAILNVRVRDGDVYPLAVRLRERGIPFVFATANDPHTEPREWQNSPWLTKPYVQGRITTLLANALSGGRIA